MIPPALVKAEEWIALIATLNDLDLPTLSIHGSIVAYTTGITLLMVRKDY